MERTIEEFIHAEVRLPSGGHVILLNTKAEITAEDGAMLQALHSRSVGGIKSHLARWIRVGSGKFMANFYVGYGHKSIGDCGTITLFIEGVSMLAAKAVQDWQLYSGQEASTRYIDFASQPILNPLGSEFGQYVQEEWRTLYVESLPLVRDHVEQMFPKTEDEEAGVYAKAVQARAFDIMRSVLPAGCSTNLSWHTNLRQAADKLEWLRHHPLLEAQHIAQAIETVLKEAYPNSFSGKRYEDSERWRKAWMEQEYLYSPMESVSEPRLVHDGIDLYLLRKWEPWLRSRPPFTELPKQIAECGTARFAFTLDFGSFRDCQRHRALIERMPLLTPGYGFHPWYLESMPLSVRDRVRQALRELVYSTLPRLPGTPVQHQYYVPMGYQVPMSLSGDLAALAYFVERRSPSDVHPTLQSVAKSMAARLTERYGNYGLLLHVNAEDVGRFSGKRGTADIVERVDA